MCRAFLKVQGIGSSRNASNDLGSDSYFKASPLDPPARRPRKHRLRPTKSGMIQIRGGGLLDNLIAEKEDEGSGSCPGERAPSKRQSCQGLLKQYNEPNLEEGIAPYLSSGDPPRDLQRDLQDL
mmetsp:Transcript_23960/g.36724  ORF Transcript_23960/g.36724 Transcript_23960/m.36724 type:complete len:124 (-) Transcript_23960:165-536(-)